MGDRAPALQVLALDLPRAPILAIGLVGSTGARLQHLQLVMAEMADFGLPGQLWVCLWRAVQGCTELASLQLVFPPDYELAFDEQVAPKKDTDYFNSFSTSRGADPAQYFCNCSWQTFMCCITLWKAHGVSGPAQVIGYLQAAQRAGPLCLARLANVALYLGYTNDGDEEDPPGFRLGAAVAPEQGAQRVCNALGKLVAADVLPALAQAVLRPCVNLPSVTYLTA